MGVRSPGLGFPGGEQLLFSLLSQGDVDTVWPTMNLSRDGDRSVLLRYGGGT